jgi:hypothetical protein
LSARDGKLTPIGQAVVNPLRDLVIRWRKEAANRDAHKQHAVATKLLRQCADELEEALSKVRAIIR